MKIDRLLAITILLLNRERVTARELSDRFEVSTRTIYRDIETLNLAGIPIMASQGTGGGISLMSGYRVDRQFFTANEILSLITTLEGITSILGDTEILGAEEKIRNLSEQKDRTKEGPVTINLSGWENIPGMKEKVAGLVKAVQSEQMVSFLYSNLKGENLERQVEPLKVFFEFANWYLLGWCRKRQGYRYFKISRLDELRILKDRFNRMSRLEKCRKWEWNEKKATEIRLLIKDPSAMRSVGYFAREDLIETDGSCYLTVRWPLDEWVYRFFMGLGDTVEILEPGHLRKEIGRRLSHAAEIYK